MSPRHRLPQAPIRSRLLAAFATVALATAALPGHAADIDYGMPAARPAAAPSDMDSARKLIHERKWKQASAVLEKVVSREPRNADAHNLLGYSYRWQDRMDESFASYGKALAIDPQHRGALNYMGIAYLKVGQPEKAEQHLQRLQQVCGAAGCDESRDLAARLTEYHAAKR